MRSPSLNPGLLAIASISSPVFALLHKFRRLIFPTKLYATPLSIVFPTVRTPPDGIVVAVKIASVAQRTPSISKNQLPVTSDHVKPTWCQ